MAAVYEYFFLVGEEETCKCLLHVMGISNVKTEANKLSSKAQTSSEKKYLGSEKMFKAMSTSKNRRSS